MASLQLRAGLRIEPVDADIADPILEEIGAIHAG